MASRVSLSLLALPIAASLTLSGALAQMASSHQGLVTQPVNDHVLTTLHGNTRPEALNPDNDRGMVADSLPLDHMLLLLKRPAALQGELDELVQQQNEPGSANYHKWLTTEQFGSRFGVAQSDIAKITEWLDSQGFTVNQVYPDRMVIDFSGTAGVVREGLHAEIHSIEVNGAMHMGNTSDPQIPTALAPVVAGVVSLNDFYPRPMHRAVATTHIDPKTGSLIPGSSNVSSQYTFTASGDTYEAVAPADLATIYNLNSLFSSGISGQGQTIVVIEDTNVYSTADWTTFRSTFGLSSYSSGSFTQVHPGSNCSNPGVVAGNDGEAILDAEYASAAAPSAAIELASCADTRTTFGGLLALENLLSASGTPPGIVSISYGECEAENGATANAAYNSTYEEAAAKGVSVFVSSGDEGAASCDADLSNATHGIGVSGFASTPYNVAVGGTDFGDSYANTNSTYWNSTNTATYGSAKSYIPEIPWNDSCASVLLSTYVTGSGVTYGSSGFCNSTTGKEDFLTTASGSGGPSGCATGSASTTGVVSGTCKGYAKPSWQSGVLGIPGDGVRDIPDVSLFAANGVWGHYYIFCWSDTRNGGAKCSGAPSGWSGAGGTSFASPIMAAIQSLVNQKTAARQGNPNPTYYKLAAAEYGTSGSSNCNSTKGNGVASTCVFYDVTQGDMDVNCTGTHSCYKPSGTYGVLSTSTTSYSKAYGTTTGYDYATGLGSVNAYNLVTQWTSVSP
jgi:subtilase family serine protease